MTNPASNNIISRSALVAATCLLPVAASAQVVWSGATDNDWATGTNWVGGNAPDTTDTARFNSDPANKSPNFAEDTTLDDIEFLSGAGSYSFTGSKLALGNGEGSHPVITNSSGAHQIFNNDIEFTATTARLNVSAGSELTLASTLGKASGVSKTSGSLIVDGGGVVNLTGSFSNYSTFANLTAQGGSTINYNTTTQDGVGWYQASGGRINLHRAPGSDGTGLRLRDDGGEIYLSTADLSVSVQSGLRFRGDEGSGKTLTFGADFEGPGTATFRSTVHLNDTGSGTNQTNQTYRFSAAEENILVLSGLIRDSEDPGSGTKVEITGPGVVRLAGSTSNTSVTPILISDGTLELAKSDGATAIADGGLVTINTEGTLRLAASDQIGDTTGLILAGGLFDVGGFDEVLGALTVGEDGGVIDFGGEAGSVTFASLASLDGTLTINGWTESASIIFTDIAGWDEDALSKVSFTGWSQVAFDEDTGTLYAVIPEPATTSALIGLGVFAGIICIRRRRA